MTDNSVSVVFDPFGISVKDFRTGKILMRCENRDNLYHITKFPSLPLNPSSFATLAPSLWNARLGHPGAPVFDSLRINKFINCNKEHVSQVCHSCSLEKHIKLPFFDSRTHIKLLRSTLLYATVR